MLDKKKVLFVDSSGNMRFTMKSMLRSLGIDHLETLAPTAALLSHIQHQPYDFIIISHNDSDKVTGIQLLEEARYQGILPESTAWVLLVSDTSRDLIVHAIDSYPDDIITKPFSAQELKRRLDALDARQIALKPIWYQLRLQNVKEALNLCDHFEPANPYYCAAQLLKGRILMAHRRYFQAARVFSRVYTQYHRREAVIMQAFCLLQEREYDQALELLGELICQNPLLLAAYDMVIKIEMARGDYFKARYILQQTTTLSPYNVLRYQRLGYCAYLGQEWEIAEPALNKAINLGKGSVYESKGPFLQLVDVGRCKVESGTANWQEVEKEVDLALKKASRFFPKDPLLPAESAFMRGNFYRGAKQPKLAEKYHDEAQVLADEQGVQLDQLDIWQQPGETPMRWLQNVPSDPSILLTNPKIDTYLQHGCHAYESGHLGKAMQYFTQILREQPDHTDALLNAAQLYLEAIRDSSYQRDKRLQMARQFLRTVEKSRLEASQQERLDYLKQVADLQLEEYPQGSLGELLWEAV